MKKFALSILTLSLTVMVQAGPEEDFPAENDGMKFLIDTYFPEHKGNEDLHYLKGAAAQNPESFDTLLEKIGGSRESLVNSCPFFKESDPRVDLARKMNQLLDGIAAELDNEDAKISESCRHAFQKVRLGLDQGKTATALVEILRDDQLEHNDEDSPEQIPSDKRLELEAKLEKVVGLSEGMSDIVELGCSINGEKQGVASGALQLVGMLGETTSKLTPFAPQLQVFGAVASVASKLGLSLIKIFSGKSKAEKLRDLVDAQEQDERTMRQLCELRRMSYLVDHYDITAPTIDKRFKRKIKLEKELETNIETLNTEHCNFNQAYEELVEVESLIADMDGVWSSLESDRKQCRLHEVRFSEPVTPQDRSTSLFYTLKDLEGLAKCEENPRGRFKRFCYSWKKYQALYSNPETDPCSSDSEREEVNRLARLLLDELPSLARAKHEIYLTAESERLALESYGEDAEFDDEQLADDAADIVADFHNLLYRQERLKAELSVIEINIESSAVASQLRAREGLKSLGDIFIGEDFSAYAEKMADEIKEASDELEEQLEFAEAYKKDYSKSRKTVDWKAHCRAARRAEASYTETYERFASVEQVCVAFGVYGTAFPPYENPGTTYHSVMNDGDRFKRACHSVRGRAKSTLKDRRKRITNVWNAVCNDKIDLPAGFDIFGNS